MRSQCSEQPTNQWRCLGFKREVGMDSESEIRMRLRFNGRIDHLAEGVGWPPTTPHRQRCVLQEVVGFILQEVVGFSLQEVVGFIEQEIGGGTLQASSDSPLNTCRPKSVSQASGYEGNEGNEGNEGDSAIVMVCLSAKFLTGWRIGFMRHMAMVRERP